MELATQPSARAAAVRPLQGQGRDNNFDLVRLLAAWSVIITHGLIMAGHPVSEDPLHRLSNGWLVLSNWAVYTFFIISGYLISFSAERSRSLGQFGFNRFLRIWPGLAVCTLVVALVLGPMVTSLPLDAYLTKAKTWEYLWSLTVFRISTGLPGVFEQQPFQEVNGSIWTLAYEVACYVLVGALAWLGLLRKPATLWVITGLWLAAYLPLQIWGYPDKLRYAFLYTTLYTDDLVRLSGYFLGGMICYRLVQQGFWFRPWMGLAAMGLLALRWWATIPANAHGYAGLWALAHPHLPWIYVLLPICTFAFCFMPVPAWLRHPLGPGRDWSYGIYIYGMPVQQTIYLLWGDAWPLWGYQVASLLAVLPLAAASWAWVEEPILKLKQRQKRPAATAAA